MKTETLSIGPGESVLEVIARDWNMKPEDVLGVLPVRRYVSASLQQGTLLCFGGDDSAMSFMVPHEVIPDLIKVLQNALEDVKQ